MENELIKLVTDTVKVAILCCGSAWLFGYGCNLIIKLFTRNI